MLMVIRCHACKRVIACREAGRPGPTRCRWHRLLGVLGVLRGAPALLLVGAVLAVGALPPTPWPR